MATKQVRVSVAAADRLERLAGAMGCAKTGELLETLSYADAAVVNLAARLQGRSEGRKP